MSERLKSFADLASAMQKAQAEHRQAALNDDIESVCSGDLLALPALLSAGLHRVPANRRNEVAEGFYKAAKECITKLAFGEALVHLGHAHELNPANWLYGLRQKLAKNALQPGTVDWRMSLIQLKADLKLPCPKDPCQCCNHFEVANCRHALESEYDHAASVGDGWYAEAVETYTVGHYFSRTRRTRWTKWLKAVKGAGQTELLGPMGDITADFVAGATPLLKLADVLVPIPPDNEKFVKRGNFAPTDSLADRLSSRLALPCVRARDKGFI